MCEVHKEDDPAAEKIQRLPELLMEWFPGVKRDMPWRREPSAYHVWISEIMLQQTRIEAAKEHYIRFLECFPSLRTLADAEEQLVMKQWEGLGYYSRARNLRKAAQICRDTYDSELPGDYEQLRALPGIGNYTAGAIGSIAFRLPVPAVDGNVLRVLTRYLEDPADIAQERVKRRYEKLLRDIIPREEPGEFNQALMELGEVICIPNGAPLCDRCPLQDSCSAKASGTQNEYPVKSAGKKRRIEEMTVLVVRCGERYAIRRRPEKGLLAGLYEFPWLPGYQDEKKITQWLEDKGVRAELRELPEAVHIFSHVEWHMRGWLLECEEVLTEADWEYRSAGEIRNGYPIPTAMKKYDRYIL